MYLIMNKIKFYYFAPHPVQYHVGIYRELAKLDNLDFKVIYEDDIGFMHFSYAVGIKELGYVFRDEDIKCRLCHKESYDDVKYLKNIKPNVLIDKLKEILG